MQGMRSLRLQGNCGTLVPFKVETIQMVFINKLEQSLD